MSMLILFALFCAFAAFGAPIYISLGAASLAYLMSVNPGMILMVPQRIWAGTESYMLIALPLFFLAGELMNRGGITKRIIDFSLQIVRPIKGGLGEVAVVASMIFGGISGSSVADISAIGSVMIPSMERKGFPKGYATGLTVAASTMGIIIPPSIPMVTYSMVSGASIGSLFLAGLVPGLMIGGIQLAVVQVYKRLNKAHLLERAEGPKQSFLEASKEGILALLMPVILVGSIVGGVATASESAAVAVLYSLGIGFFVFKELKPADMPAILKRTTLASASIMIIIGFSMIFGWIMAMEKVPETIARFFIDMNFSRVGVLLLFDLLLLFVGTFLDITPAILLVTPIFLPVMHHFGVEAVQFGAIMIVGLAIGLVTPPLGMCLNAADKITGMGIMKIAKATMPFMIGNLVVLLLVTFIPAISLWAPAVLK